MCAGSLDGAIDYRSRELDAIRIAKAMHDVRIPAPKVLAALDRLRPALAESGTDKALRGEIAVPQRLPTVMDVRKSTPRLLSGARPLSGASRKPRSILRTPCSAGRD